MLTMPNPQDWGNVQAVAQELGLTVRTVRRLATDGVIRAYRPRGTEGATATMMFWWPEIQTYGRARRQTRQGVNA